MVRARHTICLVVSVPSPAGPLRGCCCGVVVVCFGGWVDQSKKGEQAERRDKKTTVSKITCRVSQGVPIRILSSACEMK